MRCFTLRDHIAMRFAYGNACARCQRPLPTAWHADHRLPYGAGGATALANGQPLCPQCNQTKGAHMPLPTLAPWAVELRPWQRECFETYLTTANDYLIVATPGSGKTCMGVRLLHWHLLAGTAAHALIICPTRHIVSQWIDAAHKYGHVQIGTLDNGDAMRHGLVHEYHGHAVTYAQLTTELGQAAFASLVHRFQGNLVVIFDEIHHAGIDLTWGDTIRQLFGSVGYRIAMSGTPFRTDASPLPFVRYDGAGLCQADYTYTYARALSDRVCRPAVFPKFEGDLEWWNGEGILRATFKDVLSENQARQRLRAALTSNWLDGVIQEAHAHLLTCRSHGHPTAGGLVVCMDDAHARRVGERVHLLTGTPPTLVTHKEAVASEKIAEFAKSDRAWIVAVHMVSEGVDIPRLRVGVYATNILTELYFRQFVGRFVRIIDDLEGDQSAAIFIPSDEVLMTHAKAVYDERIHQVQVDLQDIYDEADSLTCDAMASGGQQELLQERSVFGYAHGESLPDGRIMLFGEVFTQQEVSYAETTLPRHLHTPEGLMAFMVAMRLHQQAPDTPPPAPPSESVQVQRQRAAREEERLKSLLFAQAMHAGLVSDTQQFYALLGQELNALVGIKKKSLCSLAQYATRRDALVRRIQEGHDASPC